MTAPLDGATVLGAVTLAATATDDVGVVGVQLMLDGNDLGPEMTSAPYAMLWDSTTVSDGSHAFTATTRDADGKVGMAASVIVNVDNLNPVAVGIFYIGPFNVASPADSPGCGTRAVPCATLDYWTANRRAAALANCSIANPCVVRLAPGTYTAAGSGANCILAQPNTTYEGRTANDQNLGDLTSVVIDGASSGNPCTGRGVINTGTFSNFTVRDLRILNAPSNGILLRTNSSPSQNITIDRVWVDESGAAGIHLEAVFNESQDCTGTGRRLDGVMIVDTRVTNSYGVGGGIIAGCSTNVTIERAEVRDSRGRGASLSFCLNNVLDPLCDDHDGIAFQGVVNGVIRDSIVSGSGEDNFDMGGHWQKTYDILLESNQGFDAGWRNVKISGGARRITFRNNIFGGSIVEFASCTTDSVLENNTIWAEEVAFQGWTHCDGCVIRNNIIRSNSNSSPTVQVSHAWTNPSIEWNNNVVVNEGGTRALTEIQGRGNCNAAVCTASCPVSWPAAQANGSLTNNGLATFQSEGNAGQWFGPGSGQGDQWGTAPAMVNPAVPSGPNLHLAPNDTIAVDVGETLSGFSDDIDDDARPQSAGWDIGADELK